MKQEPEVENKHHDKYLTICGSTAESAPRVTKNSKMAVTCKYFAAHWKHHASAKAVAQDKLVNRPIIQSFDHLLNKHLPGQALEIQSQ